MSNGTLQDYVESNKKELNDWFSLLVINRIFQGIFYLHSNNLIHRDLKPKNILIDHDFLPYISDFDYVRKVDYNEDDFIENKDIITNNIGSQLYLSPEQYHGNFVSFPTDIFSFGLIIYFLYNKKNMKRDFNNKCDKIHLLTKCPLKIQTLFEKCSKYNPSERLSLAEIKEIIISEINSFQYLELIFKKEINLKQSLIQFFYEILMMNQDNIEGLKAIFTNLPTFHILLLSFNKEDRSSFFLTLGNLYKESIVFKQDYLKAKEYYEISSKLNNSNALYNLAILYEEGQGVKQDYSKAIEYYELSSKLNNSHALFNLGSLYENGRGVKQDYLKAKAYYELSSKLNNSNALNNLALLYENGRGVKQDYSKAIEYYELSSKLNNSYALFNLGLLYEKGRGVKQDYLKAKAYYELSSKFNNSYALFNLGLLYEKGLGVQKDYLKAKEYYELSSKFNDSYALNNLGLLYEKGLGVKQDYLKAKEYYELSSKSNNSNAHNNLGLLYEKGLGVQKDYLKAKEYYELSSKFNNSNAVNNLGNLYAKGLGVKQDYLKAKEYYELSSKSNNSIALNNLGSLYFIGLGVKQDYLKAKGYYELSSKSNNSYALLNLGLIYKNGLGVKQNIVIALNYFELSANLNNPIACYILGDLYANSLEYGVELQKAILYFSKCMQISYYVDGFNRFKYPSFNNCGLIYLIEYQNEKKATEYIKEAAFGEYPHAQHNLGILKQFYFNEIENAEYYYTKSSKNNFALAEYNLGYLKEKSNNIKDSIELYKKSSDHEEEIIQFHEIKFYDKRLYISQKFVIFLANLKLADYFLSESDYTESKKYFIRAFKKLELKSTTYRFYFIFNSKADDLFSYLKYFILNHPLFNLINQPNVKIELEYNNQTLFSDIVFDDPEKLFDYVIPVQMFKDLFIKEIKSIIQTIEKILYTYPYSILLGRINIQKPKQKPKAIANPYMKNLNEHFYEGFCINGFEYHHA